ncbi:hypothetical protein HGRIS_012006 [Hohenbuehelia grisea]|uniref:Zn(2)-C6 fungal-type domain-containing protein n=1 Tax=Hohenbuehelia grisea TaxID=104357 RepID=A0ABR3IP26_9AGAR
MRPLLNPPPCRRQPHLPAASAGIASSQPRHPSPDSSPLLLPQNRHASLSAADPTSEVDEIDSPAPNTMEVESPSAVLVVPGPGSSTPAALVEPRQAGCNSFTVDADLAHREWRVEVKSALSDHPDFASPSFANSFPALWASLPYSPRGPGGGVEDQGPQATLPFIYASGARAEVRNMDPVAQNLLDHIERAEGDVRDTTAVVTEAVDAVEALAREDTKARGLKGSAVFKFVGDRVAEHEAKIDARTKDLASLGGASLTCPPKSPMSPMTWSLPSGFGTTSVTNSTKPGILSLRLLPLLLPLSSGLQTIPPPLTKKTTKAKGKGKAKAAPVSASESPPPRPPSPVPGPSKRPAPTSGEESEPIAIRRPKRSKPAPEALFLPPLSDSDVAIVEAEDLAPASGPSKRATRSQTADKGKKASAVVLKVPAAKTSILPFAKDMVSTMPFYACTRCLRLGLTCKWAPDCKACRGCQNGKVGCEEGASVRCFFDAPKTRRVYDTEGLTAIAGQANTTVVTRPFLLMLGPGHPADTAAAFHEQASTTCPGAFLEEQANIAWLAALSQRGWRGAPSPRYRGLTTRGSVVAPPCWAASVSSSGSGHRLHSYLDRLESEQGRAWLHSIDLPDDSRGEGDVEASGAEAAGESNGDLIDE